MKKTVMNRRWELTAAGRDPTVLQGGHREHLPDLPDSVFMQLWGRSSVFRIIRGLHPIASILAFRQFSGPSPRICRLLCQGRE